MICQECLMTSDRYKVIPRQFLPIPGVCAICGSNQRDCVDFGINIEYVGAFLVCTECMQEVVNIDELDLMKRIDHTKTEEENLKLRAQLDKVWETMREFQDGVVASVDHYRHNIINVIPDVVLSSPLSETGTDSFFGLT